MKTTNFIPHWRQCTDTSCLFRFPVTEEQYQSINCPRCGIETQSLSTITHEVQPAPAHHHFPQITLILDNLRSVFNVGSIFRSSDGCGLVKQIHLCGTTPTPDHKKFGKTALGSEHSIPWQYHPNAYNLCQKMKENSIPVWSLEMTARSTNLYELSHAEIIKQPEITIVVGNEVAGIDPDILEISDHILHLPLHGIKESLNVAIALSIAIYHLYSFHH